MSWLEFIAQVLSTVTWPIVALIFLVLLRTELKTLVRGIVARTGSMKRFQVPGVSIDFETEVREIAQDVQDAVTNDDAASESVMQKQDVPLPSETPRQRTFGYEQIARDDPKAAILVSFADLEGLLRRTYNRYFDDGHQRMSFSKIVANYERGGYITKEMAHTLRRLADVRNQVAHGVVARVEEDTAVAYVEAMGTALAALMSSRLYKDD